MLLCQLAFYKCILADSRHCIVDAFYLCQIVYLCQIDAFYLCQTVESIGVSSYTWCIYCSFYTWQQCTQSSGDSVNDNNAITQLRATTLGGHLAEECARRHTWNLRRAPCNSGANKLHSHTRYPPTVNAVHLDPRQSITKTPEQYRHNAAAVGAGSGSQQGPSQDRSTQWTRHRIESTTQR